MPVIKEVASIQLQTTLNDKFKRVIDYNGPLAQNDPSYFIEFCTAIMGGLIDGSPTINFSTVDVGSVGAPPRPGTGVGIGIKIPKDKFTKALYVGLRESIIEKNGDTVHPEWCDEWDSNEVDLPEGHCSLKPNQYNPYGILTALSEGIAEVVCDRWLTDWNLTSTHLIVYAGVGKIVKGGFQGVVPDAISSAIVGLSTKLNGPMWSEYARVIGSVYAKMITEEAEGETAISGVCVPNQSQVCGIGGSGVGTGMAS